MISVSIVSHKQFNQVLNTIKSFELIEKNFFFYLITINVSEEYEEQKLKNLVGKNFKLIINNYPKGFGANHNFAFNYVKDEVFIICNPDIKVKKFNVKKFNIKFSKLFLYAPKVINEKSGELYFDLRDFPSLRNILLRQINKKFFKIIMKKIINENLKYSWFPGYFMVISKDLFNQIKGFDEKYFMYCEDADLCIRVKKIRCLIKKDTDIVVSHEGQFSSNNSLKYLIIHIKSIIRINLKRYLRKF